ncbi:MAG: alpha/beta hydrolase [Desulfarculus sp.]|jgi:pimeloyl-ACP methyl ester carboxylesterase|nr:MAG: alpha/beta hydrolase [Desulfarculus sp.]
MPGISIDPQIIETQRGPVEYDLTPGDGPVILCSHGGLGGVDQARVMAGWVDTTRFRVLSVSRPGYLGTPLASGPTIEDQADLFAALLTSLGIQKAAVMSASAGGPPAYIFAIQHPERVWALVAIDSVSGYYDMPETAGPITQALFVTDWGQKLVKKIGEKRPDLFLKQIFQSEAYFTKEQLAKHLKFALGSEQAKAFVMAFMNTMNPYKPRKAGTENDMAVYRELTHLPVQNIRCPSLIIHGTHDADVKFYDGVYAYEHIPNAERFWIEEGSHLGFWINPHSAEAQAAARDFLERHNPK